MNFNLTIENLGNISKAEINVKPFTLIAGENSSGKSFATKSLYSILDTLNKDYVTWEFLSYFRKIQRSLNIFEEKLKTKATIDTKFINQFHSEYEPFLLTIVEEYQSSDIQVQESISKEFELNILSILGEIELYHQQRKNLQKFKNIDDC